MLKTKLPRLSDVLSKFLTSVISYTLILIQETCLLSPPFTTQHSYWCLFPQNHYSLTEVVISYNSRPLFIW